MGNQEGDMGSGSTKLENKKSEQPINTNCNAKSNDRENSEEPAEVSGKLEVNVFFDGTRNNRYNTEEGRKNPESRKKDISYDNYYSNVALLYMALLAKENAQEDGSPTKIYIEGAGTFRGETDSAAGLGLARGDSGILVRVATAIETIASIMKDMNDGPVSVLTINAYGFSRGSAYARFFCFLMKAEGSDREYVDGKWFYWGEVKNALKSLDTELRGKSRAKVFIKFVGIYDTVSSIGYGHYDDIPEFRLDIGKKQQIKRIVHLTAQNDFREHFPLTQIKAATRQGIGFECSFPGAHSDIGGGYPETWDDAEASPSFGSYDITSMHENWIHWRWFVDMGYFNATDSGFGAHFGPDDDLRFDSDWFWYSPDPTPYRSGQVLVRERITTYHYQFVLAEIMADIMKKEIKCDFDDEYTDMIPRINEMKKEKSPLPAFAVKAHAYIMASYKNGGAGYSVPLLSKAEMKEIYHKYIHNSLDYMGAITTGSPANIGTINNKSDPTDYMSATRPHVTEGYDES